MARAKSAVLTTADKKAVIKDLKAKSKAVEAAVKGSNKAQDQAAKAFIKANAAHDKAHTKLVNEAAKLKAELDAIAAAA